MFLRLDRFVNVNYFVNIDELDTMKQMAFPGFVKWAENAL